MKLSYKFSFSILQYNLCSLSFEGERERERNWRERKRETGVREREGYKNETSVGERKIGKEIRVEERGRDRTTEREKERQG